MDLEVQGRIKELAESLGRANLMVVLGAPNVDSSLIQFETVTRGDPTYSGPLAGVELGLDTYHIFEPAMKAVIDAEKYEELLGTIELALEAETIVQALREARGAPAQ
ncbi:MAG: glycine/sarcosine/betaine reductase complex protein A [Deltaproteobacteria bacterium RIFCSPLOWO2_02_FULL_57_26]|nr:MAG: glycine/sarcosine/betaine reductase complex protein A [Deltaproteobacteria bacterium RIFCSPLOWO2_02_FULL_57_26]